MIVKKKKKVNSSLFTAFYITFFCIFVLSIGFFQLKKITDISGGVLGITTNLTSNAGEGCGGPTGQKCNSSLDCIQVQKDMYTSKVEFTGLCGKKDVFVLKTLAIPSCNRGCNTNKDCLSGLTCVTMPQGKCSVYVAGSKTKCVFTGNCRNAGCSDSATCTCSHPTSTPTVSPTTSPTPIASADTVSVYMTTANVKKDQQFSVYCAYRRSNGTIVNDEDIDCLKPESSTDVECSWVKGVNSISPIYGFQYTCKAKNTGTKTIACKTYYSWNNSSCLKKNPPLTLGLFSKSVQVTVQ